MTVRQPAAWRRMAKASPPKPLPITAAESLSSISHRDFVAQSAQLREGALGPACACFIEASFERLECVIKTALSALACGGNQVMRLDPRLQRRRVGQLADGGEKFFVVTRGAFLRGAGPDPGGPRQNQILIALGRLASADHIAQIVKHLQRDA